MNFQSIWIKIENLHKFLQKFRLKMTTLNRQLRPQTFRLAKTFASLRQPRRKFEASEFSLASSLNPLWPFSRQTVSLASIRQPQFASLIRQPNPLWPFFPLDRQTVSLALIRQPKFASLDYGFKMLKILKKIPFLMSAMAKKMVILQFPLPGRKVND